MRLEKTERTIIIALVSTLIFAFAISVSLKNRPFTKIAMESFNAEEFKNNPEQAVSPILAVSAVGKMNINEASVEDLMKLKGVGKKLAGAIAEYRYKNGSFRSIDDIKNVKGVGVALFENIKDKITAE